MVVTFYNTLGLVKYQIKYYKPRPRAALYVRDELSVQMNEEKSGQVKFKGIKFTL